MPIDVKDLPQVPATWGTPERFAAAVDRWPGNARTFTTDAPAFLTSVLSTFGQMAHALAARLKANQARSDAQRRSGPSRRQARDRRRAQVCVEAKATLRNHPEWSWRAVARNVRRKLPAPVAGQRLPSLRTLEADLSALVREGELPAGRKKVRKD